MKKQETKKQKQTTTIKRGELITIRAKGRTFHAKTFGLQLARTQRVFLRRDQFGQKVYKTIYHAVEE